jgi:hypothetical protein
VVSEGEKAGRLVNQYQSCAPWFRANFHGHAHDDASAVDLVQAYVELGYSIVGVEPWYLPAVRKRFTDGKVLLVSAPEDGAWPHLIAVAPKEGAGEGGEKPTTLQARIDAIRGRGADPAGLAFVCHPAWSGIGARELLEVTGYLGIEIYNEAVQRINGKGKSIETWDTLLGEGKRVWGVATDDAHSIGNLAGRRDVGQGWVVIQSESLSEEAVLRALTAGAFYSSMGPEFHSIDLQGDRLTVASSPCVEVHFVSAATGGHSIYTPVTEPTRRGRTEFALDLSSARWLKKYLRVEIIDAQGRAAWSNPLFPPES